MCVRELCQRAFMNSNTFSLPPCVRYCFSFSQQDFFSCVLLILSPVYTALSLSLLGILRRVHMHRNTSHLSSRPLVFADSFWNSFFLSDAFSLFKKQPPSKLCLSVSLCMKILFCVALDSCMYAAPLTSHTRWDDEMVCSTASFMIPSS